MEMGETTKELRGIAQGPEEFTKHTPDSEKLPQTIAPRLTTAYDVAQVVNREAEKGRRYGFSLDRERIAEYLRSLADRVESSRDIDNSLIPMEFDVVTRAEHHEYTSTFVCFHFAERQ